VTDRTHDRWAEPAREIPWTEPRESGGEEPREGGRWDGPQDIQWDTPRIPASYGVPRLLAVQTGPGDKGDTGKTSKRRRKLRLWQEISLLLVIAFSLMFLVRTFLIQAFYIPSVSMEETLVVGDRVSVNRVVYTFGDPERGDVVVFRGPGNWAPDFQSDPNASFFSKVGNGLSDLVGVGKPGEKDFIKRVIGLPGDRVSCCDVKGRIFVNGVAVDEPYVTKNANKDNPKTPGQCGPRQFDEVVVEPGMLFVMGDNRFVSQDSRCRGFVPIENVIGRAGTIVWPPSRWHGISQPEPFKDVPAPAGQALGEPSRTPPVPIDAAFVLPSIVPVWLVGMKRFASRRLRA
jgi:signal peptidase I